MADRSMKIYINHLQTICIHPVKWHLETLSRLGGVRRQRFAPSSTAQHSSTAGPPVFRNKWTKVCTDQVSLWKKLVFEIRSLRFARNNNCLGERMTFSQSQVNEYCGLKESYLLIKSPYNRIIKINYLG